MTSQGAEEMELQLTAVEWRCDSWILCRRLADV
jgi:hypothetical protein